MRSAPCFRDPPAAWWARSKWPSSPVSRAFWASIWAALPPTSACATASRAKRWKLPSTAFRCACRCSISTPWARAAAPSRAWMKAGCCAWVPQSAGADPGPACYGKGDLPTVTDAHVVLGRIAADQLIGGEMHLDTARAATAVDSIAHQLGISRVRAAAGHPARRQRQHGAGHSSGFGGTRSRSARLRAGRLRRLRRTARLRDRAGAGHSRPCWFPSTRALSPRSACCWRAACAITRPAC